MFELWFFAAFIFGVVVGVAAMVRAAHFDKIVQKMRAPPSPLATYRPFCVRCSFDVAKAGQQAMRQMQERS